MDAMPADGPRALGARLGAERRRRGLTKPEMARRMIPHLTEQCPSLDTLVSYLKRWERGEHNITERYRFACAKALGMDQAGLFGPQRMPQPSWPGALAPPGAPAWPGSVDELGTISDWDDMERRRLLLAALGLGAGALPGGEAIRQLLDPDMRDRLAHAQRRPQRIDDTTVQSLAGVLSAQRRAEDTLGSAALLVPVTAQLTSVVELAAEARGPVRPAVIDLAEQWSQFAAWLHMSVRDFPAARALWRQTLELATEGGDVTMTATALTYQAEMAWLSGQTGPMIGLAQAAQRDSRAATAQRAYSASIEGRGHAMNGDATAAERKLAEVADFANQPAGERPWLYWCTPQLFECRRGVALGYLAHIGRYRDQAIEALTAGYAGLRADVRSSEWTADVLVHRAAVHARGGDVGEACADAMKAIPIARQTDSVSLGTLLAELHTGLAARWPDDARVTELAGALG